MSKRDVKFVEILYRYEDSVTKNPGKDVVDKRHIDKL